MKRDAADKWFSDVVRAKAAYTCENCHQKGRMECCHIFGRAAKSVRWSLDNAVTLCHYHHRMFTESPYEFIAWLESVYGAGHLEILREKSQAIFKTNKQTRAQIAKHYRDQVRQHEQDPSIEFISYN